MTVKKDPTPKKKKNLNKGKKKDWSFYAIIICLIIIAIPLTYLGYHAISASYQTGKPVYGNRFDGDLDPAITSEQKKLIEESVTTLANVEGVTVDVISATVRVNIDVVDDTSRERIAEVANEAYNAVNAQTPVETYFTASDTHKMYDLEINVYNYAKPTEEQKPGLIYFLFSKPSNTETVRGDYLNETRSPELVARLIESQSKEDEEPKDPAVDQKEPAASDEE